MWPHFNFEITFFSLLFMIFDCTALFCFCTLRLNWLDLLTSFFNPGLIDCIALEFVCLGGSRRATGFLHKNWSFWKWFVLICDALCSGNHGNINHFDTTATIELWLQWRRAATLNFWMGIVNFSISQLFVYIFAGKLNALICLNEAVLVIGSQDQASKSASAIGTIDLNGCIAPGPKSMISKGLIHSNQGFWINLSSTFYPWNRIESSLHHGL